MRFEELECVQESALQFLLRLNADDLFLHTSLPSLNSVISILPGSITEIDGAIGTGKTQICYSIAAKFLSNNKTARIGWISAIPLRTDMLQKHLNDEVHLDRLICKTPESFYELFHDLDYMMHIRKILKIEVLFVENIDALLHDTVYQNETGRQRQTDFMEKLNKFARNGTTVIVTNHTTTWRGYQAPALGQTLVSQIKNRIFIEKEENDRNEDGIRVVSIQKSGEVVTSEAKFKITENGLASA